MEHPGFKAVQRGIAAKRKVSMKAAARILAKSSRNASIRAKLKNPNLLKVQG